MSTPFLRPGGCLGVCFSPPGPFTHGAQLAAMRLPRSVPLVPMVRRSHLSISALLYRLPPHRPCPASSSLWMKPGWQARLLRHWVTGVGPHPLSRGLLVCNWGLEGPLRFQRDWAWDWDRVVVGPGHRCGGESPALPLTPTGPRPALCPFGLTCEGKISISALPCSLAGQLCRRDKFSSSQAELRQRLSPRECVCVHCCQRPPGSRGSGRPGGQDVGSQHGPGPQGRRARSAGAGRRGGATVPMAPVPGQPGTGWPHQPLGPSPSPPGWRGCPLSVQAAVRLVS